MVKGNTLTADSAEYYQAQGRLFLVGNVHYVEPRSDCQLADDDLLPERRSPSCRGERRGGHVEWKYAARPKYGLLPQHNAASIGANVRAGTAHCYTRPERHDRTRAPTRYRTSRCQPDNDGRGQPRLRGGQGSDHPARSPRNRGFRVHGQRKRFRAPDARADGEGFGEPRVYAHRRRDRRLLTEQAARARRRERQVDMR